MEQKIVYLDVQISGQSSIYRTFTSDFIKYSDPEEIGKIVQDMFDTAENTEGEKIFDSKQA